MAIRVLKRALTSCPRRSGVTLSLSLYLRGVHWQGPRGAEYATGSRSHGKWKYTIVSWKLRSVSVTGDAEDKMLPAALTLATSSQIVRQQT